MTLHETTNGLDVALGEDGLPARVTLTLDHRTIGAQLTALSGACSLLADAAPDASGEFRWDYVERQLRQMGLDLG